MVFVRDKTLPDRYLMISCVDDYNCYYLKGSFFSVHRHLGCEYVVIRSVLFIHDCSNVTVPDILRLTRTRLGSSISRHLVNPLIGVWSSR